MDRTGGEASIVDRLEDRRTESGGECVLLDRDRPRVGLDHFQDRWVERLDESGVDDGRLDPLGGESTGSGQGRTEERAAGDDQAVGPAPQDLAAGPLHRGPGAGVVLDPGLGVADRHWARLLE